MVSLLSSLYWPLSGHFYILQEEHANSNHPDLATIPKRNFPETEKGPSASLQQRTAVVATDPSTIILTRQGMLDQGARRGRSAVGRIRAKRDQAAAASSNSGTNPLWFWCRPRPTSTTNSTTMEGLFFVKTPKTASQSINRILKRVIRQVGSRTNNLCHFRGQHIRPNSATKAGGPASGYRHRHDTFSLLVTSVRDPAPRALSRIYWTLSTRQMYPKNTPQPQQQMISILQKALAHWKDIEGGTISEGQGGFQINYVSLQQIPPHAAWNAATPTQVLRPQQLEDHIQHHILDEYDFILIQERLEESLVALQLLLGLESSDILSMPLHVGGSYLYDRHVGCIQLYSPPSLPHLSNKHKDNNNNDNSLVVQFLDDYFQSPTWYAQNYGDYILLGAAHASLDQTIEELNANNDQFTRALQDFRILQQRVYETCSRQVVFPCSHNGTIQREDYQLGSGRSAGGDRYPQQDIEHCIDQVVAEEKAAKATTEVAADPKQHFMQ
jgi:hypothetical protein